MTQLLDEIEACIPALRRYARALTGNADLADDLVQDCLERAIRKRHLWSPTGNLKSWLFTMLINIYRNQLRALKNRPALASIDEMSNEPSVAASQPDQVALAETRRALGTLPLEQREVLLLVTIEGMPYKEAATILGIPIGTLMSRLGRGRKRLRQLVDYEPKKTETSSLRRVK
ncbi:sigma-70 family RNA polymerase sigma factor [Hyphomicrobiales bacterium 4NK60-0047b]